MFRVSRNRRGDDPHPRMLLFAVAAALALAGMFFAIDWMITAAIVILAAGMIAGVVARRREAGDDGQDDSA